MHKKKLSTVALPVLAALLLSGCGGKYSNDFLGPWFFKISDGFVNLAFNLNSAIGRALYTVNNMLSTDLLEQAKTAYGSFSGYVKIFQWIALVYVAIKFGQLIFKNYFTENQKYAVSSVSILKRLVVAFALTWAMPYAVFTGYFGFSEAGIAVANQIGGFSADSDGGSGPYYKLYDEMSNVGINGATYCRFNSDVPTPPVDGGPGVVMTDPGDSSGTGNETLDKMLRARAKEDIEGIDKYIDGDVTEESKYNELVKEYRDVWNETCGEFSADNAYVDHNVYRVAEAINAGSNRNILVLKAGSTSLASIGAVIVSCLYALVGSVSLIRRLLDALMLVATGWYYIGNYVTDEDGQYLSKFLAQLGSICVTQFTILAEVSLFYSMQAGLPADTNLVFVLASNLAWLLLLIGTPSAIAGMFNQTGAVAAGAKLGSHVVGAMTRK